MSDAASKPPILCFGEMLWDSLPRAIFPGGAPLNVAYHLNRLGHRALPISAVGDDFLGSEFRRRLEYWGISGELVATIPGKPTGAVLVSIDPKGVPSYEFVADSAWDHLRFEESRMPIVESADAFIFGTLALRSGSNHTLLLELLTYAAGAFKVFDVNFREPHVDVDLTTELAAEADLIKLNDDELARMLDVPVKNLEPETHARKLAAAVECPRICLTAGATGAGLLIDDQWHWEKTRPVEVRDTVGSGDSFLAMLLHSLLAKTDPALALNRACRMAEFLAASDGAIPDYKIGRDGLPVRP